MTRPLIIEVKNRLTKNIALVSILQRSNFNGMIRFNNKGNYNVPFGRKPRDFKKH